MLHVFKIIGLYLMVIINNSLAKDNFNHPLISKIIQPGVISAASISSNNSMQELNASVSGVHKRNCLIVIPKISTYELYSDWLGFVKKSTYNRKNKKLTMHLEHTLLPFKMLLEVEIPRLMNSQRTHFSLNKGFLKGLIGQVYWKPLKRGCLVSTHIKWEGKKSPIPNLVFEIFVQTLAKKALEKLFRIAST